MLPYESKMAVHLVGELLEISRPVSSRIGKLRFERLRQFTLNPGPWAGIYSRCLQDKETIGHIHWVFPNDLVWEIQYLTRDVCLRWAHTLIALAVQACFAHQWMRARDYLEFLQDMRPFLQAA